VETRAEHFFCFNPCRLASVRLAQRAAASFPAWLPARPAQEGLCFQSNSRIMRTWMLLLALSFVCVPAVASEQIPDSATLRQLAAAAYGPIPSNFRQVIEFNGTLSGREVTYRLASDSRVVRDVGPIHNESGSYRGERWHQTANGHTVVDLPDPGLATGETFNVTVQRVSAPVDAYLVSTLNVRGDGTLEYFDPTTHYLIRRETVAGNGKTATEYDDFKPFGARNLAGHWHVRDDTAKTDIDYYVREFASNVVSDVDVARPASRRQLVEFPARVDGVRLPARFTRDGHVIVRITVGERGLDFLLDTGSSAVTIDPGTARSLGITVFNRESSSMNAGRYDTGEAILPEVKVGDLTLPDVVVSVLPFGWQVDGETKAVGLLGFDFLCEMGVTIDYQHQTVTAERFGTYQAPDDPQTIRLAIRLGTQQPVTSATINGAIAERTVLDTGAAGALQIFDYFARRHPEALVEDAGLGARSRVPHVFTGAGGLYLAKPYAIEDLQLGQASFHDFIGFRAMSRSSFPVNEDGLIGVSFLRLFDVYLDYPNDKVYLVPNKTAKKAVQE
jgi:predicted aspartyl protease